MPFFDNLSKKVSDAAKSAARKSGDLVEVTKLNRAISSEEEKIKEIYLKIGESVFGKVQNGQSFDDDLIGLCSQIAEINSSIDALRQKILDIKDLSICPGCKNEVEQGTLFCPKCGTKIENRQNGEDAAQDYIPMQENAGLQVEEQKPAVKFCPSCGNKYVEGTLFCPSCGNKLQ